MIVKHLGAWTLEQQSGRLMACGPRWSDCPIRYTDGRIAYDFPERVPERVKAAVRAEFNRAEYANDYKRRETSR